MKGPRMKGSVRIKVIRPEEADSRDEGSVEEGSVGGRVRWKKGLRKKGPVRRVPGRRVRGPKNCAVYTSVTMVGVIWCSN